MTTGNKEWLTFQEAAEYLGVSYPRFTIAVKKGVYPVHSVPGFANKKRISRSKLDRMMEDSADTQENGDNPPPPSPPVEYEDND